MTRPSDHGHVYPARAIALVRYPLHHWVLHRPTNTLCRVVAQEPPDSPVPTRYRLELPRTKAKIHAVPEELYTATLKQAREARLQFPEDPAIPPA